MVSGEHLDVALLCGVVQRRSAVGFARHGVDRGTPGKERLDDILLPVVRGD